MKRQNVPSTTADFKEYLNDACMSGDHEKEKCNQTSCHSVYTD